MAVTVQDVKKLREMTGSGLMDCKKALEEANGDFEKAIEILRKKGIKTIASRKDREAKEGALFIRRTEDRKTIYVIELICETDFVGKNELFRSTGEKIIDLVLQKQPDTLEQTLNLQFDNGLSVKEVVVDIAGKFGERIELPRFIKFTGDYVSYYLHHGEKLAGLVAFSGVINPNEFEPVGFDIAMQVVAMSPIALDESDVPKELIEKEKEIAKELARKEGKPENILEKIAEGKVKKYLQEVTLLHQAFFKDGKKTVKSYLEEKAPGVKITAFQRIQVGEKSTDA